MTFEVEAEYWIRILSLRSKFEVCIWSWSLKSKGDVLVLKLKIFDAFLVVGVVWGSYLGGHPEPNQNIGHLHLFFLFIEFAVDFFFQNQGHTEMGSN